MTLQMLINTEEKRACGLKGRSTQEFSKGKSIAGLNQVDQWQDQHSAAYPRVRERLHLITPVRWSWGVSCVTASGSRGQIECR
jgi:hypothetical protein